ncbi:RNA polymerase sigma-54 factor [bacterium]|nr:RNA polymerase sigma-54 factor [bacterium]
MALEIKQSLKLSQQLVMTPQLQQAIKLLQLNRMELQEVVTQEMMENPILEEVSETADGEGAPSTEEMNPASSDPEAEQLRDEESLIKPKGPEEQLVAGKDDFNWESYVEEFNSTSSSAPSMREINDELPSFENVLTKTTTLEDHLAWQLSMIALADGEKKLGELIVGNLSDDGYLNANLEDLAKEAQLELEDAEEVLKMIQSFDPLGVGSRNLQECLMIQAHFMNPRQPLVEQIISHHLGDLERKNYSSIAKTIDITPDIYVYKVADEFMIVLNEDGMPKLRISPYYRNILSSAQKDQNKVTKEYVQEKLRSAVWLIRSIHNRQKTIYKVTEAIVKRQRDFFERGVQQLKPMILKDVANDIGMHESTISRVTTNKFVHTPVGIFELKYFFNSSINAADGSDSLASEAVKEKIRQMIQKEDQRNPLSDQKIVELLRTENIDIARRTVAKYRDMLGILSSGKRKKVI